MHILHFQAVTERRCPRVNVRTWQVILLSFYPPALSQLPKICIPGISWSTSCFYTFGPLLHFSSVTLPLRSSNLMVSVACCGTWPCGREWWSVCLIFVWPSFPSSGSCCLLITPLASPLGCKEKNEKQWPPL